MAAAIPEVWGASLKGSRILVSARLFTPTAALGASTPLLCQVFHPPSPQSLSEVAFCSSQTQFSVQGGLRSSSRRCFLSAGCPPVSDLLLVFINAASAPIFPAPHPAHMVAEIGGTLPELFIYLTGRRPVRDFYPRRDPEVII